MGLTIMLKHTLALGAAMAAALALSAPANASTTYLSTATTASSPNGLSPVIDFTAPGGATVDVTVTDCCVVGDYYATYIDGGLIGTTPYEPEYGSNSGFPNSMATFVTTLGAGSAHTVQVADQTTFYLPAGLSIDITSAAVPEPDAWALMMLGMFGLGALLRSRRSAALAAQLSA